MWASLNPAIYTIAKGANYTNAFHDITVGNNTNTSSSTHFFATAGYDLCTGLGTPNGANLIYALVPVPLILQQPVNEAVAPGNNATFSVVLAVSSCRLFYQWRFRWHEYFAGDQFGVTPSPTPAIGQTGAYAVVISNSPVISVASSNVTLTVSAPPVFTLEPQSQSVPPGANVTFTGAASGTPAPTYQWQFNGNDIAGATDTSLTLINVQSSNQGNYTLTASNPGGTIISSNAVLTVQSPPGISTQPASRTVNQGISAVFAVSAGGSPTLHYQWQFAGADIANATSSFYIISNPQFNQSGNYQAVITNSYGAVTSAVATLTVNAPPMITSQPQGENLTVGDTASFTVAATGSTPLSCHWLFNNISLSDNARISGSQTTQLTINGVLVSDTGNYQAVIVNSFGSTNSSMAMLAVAERPTPTLTWVAPSWRQLPRHRAEFRAAKRHRQSAGKFCVATTTHRQRAQRKAPICSR